MADTYITVFGDNVVPPSESSYGAVTLSADTTFQWPELAVGDYLLYDLLDVSATGAYSILLPSAEQVSEGRTVTFKNLSAYTITLKDVGLNTVGTLTTGQVQSLYLTDNSTANGIWSLIALGAGTTLADAAALAGDGLMARLSKLSPALFNRQSSGNVTVDETLWAQVAVSFATGAVTYTLPVGTAAYNGFFFHVANQGAGTLQLAPQSSQTIDGQAGKLLQPGESATVFYCGASTNKWLTIGYGRSTQFQFTKLVLDVSAGGTITISSTQAQNKLMQFIGTVGAAVTVIVPQIVAVYYLECSYAGAFPLTIETVTGSGVVLGQNDRAIVYCDGVDVVVAQTTIGVTNISGGTAGAVVYQQGVSTTGFTVPGSVGNPLVSGGATAPTFVPGITFSRDGSHSSRISMRSSAAICKPDLYFQNSGAAAASCVGILPGEGGSASSLTLYKGTDLYDDPGSVTINIWGQAARLSTGAGSATTPSLYLGAGSTSLVLSDDAGNGYAPGLHFSGITPRLYGDFSNTTVSSRPHFQTRDANANTHLGVIPSGTAVQSSLTLYNSSDPNNAATAQLNVDASASKLIAGKTGTGTHLPLALNTGGTDKLVLGEGAEGTYTFNGTAPRLVADFSNGTHSKRLMIQSSTTNGPSALGILPNGTSNSSYLTTYNSPDADNSSFLYIGVTATKASLTSTKAGTGTHLPLALNVGGADVVTYSEAAATLGNMTASVARNSSLAHSVTNGGAGASANSVVQVVTNAGSLYMQKASVAGGGIASLYTAGGVFNIGTTDANQLRLRTTGADRVWIGSTGNVGVGAENTGTYGKFTLSGTGYQAITVVDSEASGAVGGIAANGIYSVTVGSISNHDLSLIVNGTARFRVNTTGDSLHVYPAGGLGYGAGAGGAVTQTTSKSTTITLNRPCGRVTLNNAALAAGAMVNFQFHNSLVRGTDSVVTTLPYDGVISASNYELTTSCTDSVIACYLRNKSGVSLSEAVAFDFKLLKGANS